MKSLLLLYLLLTFSLSTYSFVRVPNLVTPSLSMMKSIATSKPESVVWKCQICGWKNSFKNRVCGGMSSSRKFISEPGRTKHFGCGALPPSSYTFPERGETEKTELSPSLKLSLKPWSLIHGQVLEVWHDGQFKIGNVQLILNEHDAKTDFLSFHSMIPLLVFNPNLDLHLSKDNDLGQKSCDQEGRVKLSRSSKKYFKKHNKWKRKQVLEFGPVCNDERYDNEKENRNGNDPYFDKNKRELIFISYDDIIGTWQSPFEYSSVEANTQKGSDAHETYENNKKLAYFPKTLKEWSEIHHNAQILLSDFRNEDPEPVEVDEGERKRNWKLLGRRYSNQVVFSMRRAAYKVWKLFNSQRLGNKELSFNNENRQRKNTLRENLIKSEIDSIIQGELTTSMVAVYLLTGRLVLSSFACQEALDQLKLKPYLYAAVHYAAAHVLSVGCSSLYTRRIAFKTNVVFIEKGNNNSMPPSTLNSVNKVDPTFSSSDKFAQQKYLESSNRLNSSELDVEVDDEEEHFETDKEELIKSDDNADGGYDSLTSDRDVGLKNHTQGHHLKESMACRCSKVWVCGGGWLPLTVPRALDKPQW